LAALKVEVADLKPPEGSRYLRAGSPLAFPCPFNPRNILRVPAITPFAKDMARSTFLIQMAVSDIILAV